MYGLNLGQDATYQRRGQRRQEARVAGGGFTAGLAIGQRVRHPLRSERPGTDHPKARHALRQLVFQQVESGRVRRVELGDLLACDKSCKLVEELRGTDKG